MIDMVGFAPICLLSKLVQSLELLQLFLRINLSLIRLFGIEIVVLVHTDKQIKFCLHVILERDLPMFLGRYILAKIVYIFMPEVQSQIEKAVLLLHVS